jgi:hypothetical protein
MRSANPSPALSGFCDMRATYQNRPCLSARFPTSRIRENLAMGGWRAEHLAASARPWIGEKAPLALGGGERGLSLGREIAPSKRQRCA